MQYRLLLLDNYDSFTYNLKDYFEQLGCECVVVRNDETDISGLSGINFDGIVISPGPGRPFDAGILNKVIQEYHASVPILGICLGHQAIAEFFGAKLIKASYPMHGKVSQVLHAGDSLFAGLPVPMQVCRYHSLIVEWEGSAEITAIAHTQQGEVMALKHNTLPIYGVQFHPEAILTQSGMELLKNWLTCVPASKPMVFV